MKLGKYFYLSEFLVSQTAARNGIVITPTPGTTRNLKKLVREILDPLREEVRRPIIVSSGYRPPQVNRLVGGSPTSQHLSGEACDFNVQGLTPFTVCKLIVAMGLPFDQLIHEFGAWVHVSHSYDMPQRKQQLTAKKVNGRTRYYKGIIQ